MACACKNKNRAKANKVVVKRTPIQHTNNTTVNRGGGMKRIIRRELK